MWNDTPLSPRHYSRYSLPQIYETSPHNIAPTKGCPCHMFSLIFKPIINYPVSLLSIVLEFSVETVPPFVFVFVDSTIGCYMAVFYTIIARAFEELAIFSFFLQSLVLETFLLYLFLVSWFGLTPFSRTNGFVSWGPCMLYLRY